MVKILILVSFVFVSLVSVGAQQRTLIAEIEPESGTWITVSPAGAGFTAIMPGKPTETTQPVEGRPDCTHHLMVVTTQLAGYFVSYVEFPEVITDPNKIKEILDRGREGGLASSKGELLSEKEIKLKEYLGREWSVKLPNGLFATARAYWVKHSLYQAIFLTAPSASDSAELIKRRQEMGNKFFDSFRLSGDNVSGAEARP